jgi:hypothetical protein
MRTQRRLLIPAFIACFSLLCTHGVASANERGYGDDATQGFSSSQVDPDGITLQAGEFAWLPAADTASASPVTMLVNLSEQRGYLYRDGRRIAVTTVSTGKPGHDTPIGVFPIIGKERMHHSSRYENAPMPWMQRLTDWGHALHAGAVRPYPASHGCVRLPAKFAEQLFNLTKPGDLVVISQDNSPRSLAIAIAAAGADSQTAELVGVTEPLPHIVFAQPEQKGAPDAAAAVGSASVTGL